MRSRRRGSGLLGTLGAVIVAVVCGAGVMFLALRMGVLPGTLGQEAVLVPTTPPLVTPVPVKPAATLTAGPTIATQSPTVGAPSATVQAAPTAEKPRAAAANAANGYLQAWQAQRYPDMYRLLSAGSKQTIAEDRFVSRHQAITLGAGINTMKVAVPTMTEPPATAARVDVGFRITFQTARLGEFSEDNRLVLVSEAGEWRVEWTPGLIFRELTPDRTVRFVPDDPVRGAILDRNGIPLAAQGRALTLGVIPGKIKDQAAVLAELTKFLGMPTETIRLKIASAKPDWWVPFRDFPIDRLDELNRRFAKLDGVLAEEKDSRVYPQGQIGAHVVGFVAAVTPDELRTLSARGYEEGDLVGKAGIERGAEEVLAGVRGGRLIIANADGETVRVVADRPAKHGGTVKLTIDIEVQRSAEKVLGDKVGSIVMMDPRDNGILALVSRPAFDPNGFIFGFSDVEWKKLSDDPRRPFQARANLSTYASGSVYKVITMAAGLEKGGFKPTSQFDCNGKWGVLDPKKPMGDWIPTGHGRLDLSQGLVESCDIVFYDVGHKLNQIDPRILPEYSGQFGLGEPTGIKWLPEAEGIVPSPDWKKRTLRQEWFPGDAVNLSIGQGYLDTTPLQVANVYATLANGGTLRTPVLIRSIVPGDGGPPQEFASQEKRRVPVSGQNIAVIREALKRVANSPRGTALYAFGSYTKSVAAKTGSAENQHADAHAWFAGYAPAEEPRVVVVVMVEGGKTGGTVAAPLGREVVEIILGK